MLVDEILIVEFLAVDRLAARTLHHNQAAVSKFAHIIYPEASSRITASTGRRIYPPQVREVHIHYPS